VIRLARPDECAALTALGVRSKAHWGYDAAFMTQCRDSLRVRPEAIRAGWVFVAVDARDRPLGVAQVDLVDGAADLGLLFVDPPAIGTGAGRRLLRHAMDAVARAGLVSMSILADPYAAPFYKRMGAKLRCMAPSDAVPGRLLPLYDLAIAPASGPRAR
jgi:GNAT superfamily N-acetyltransferase